MDLLTLLLAKKLGGGGGGGGSGSETDLKDLEIYLADFLNDPPTITDGALNKYTRKLVA